MINYVHNCYSVFIRPFVMFGSSYFFADFSVSLVDIRLGHVRMVVNCFEAKYKEFEP